MSSSNNFILLTFYPNLLIFNFNFNKLGRFYIKLPKYLILSSSKTLLKKFRFKLVKLGRCFMNYPRYFIFSLLHPRLLLDKSNYRCYKLCRFFNLIFVNYYI